MLPSLIVLISMRYARAALLAKTSSAASGTTRPPKAGVRGTNFRASVELHHHSDSKKSDISNHGMQPFRFWGFRVWSPVRNPKLSVARRQNHIYFLHLMPRPLLRLARSCAETMSRFVRLLRTPTMHERANSYRMERFDAALLNILCRDHSCDIEIIYLV